LQYPATVIFRLLNMQWKALTQHTAKYVVSNAEVINYYAVSATTSQRAGQPKYRKSLPGWSKKCFSSPKIPERLLGPPNFLFNGLLTSCPWE
jgi:hypothetical protein